MLKKMIVVILLMTLLLVVVGSLTAQPPGRGFGGRRGRGPGMGFSAAQGQPPLPVNEEEKKILSVLEGMDPGQSRGMMNVPREDGRILRLLTRGCRCQARRGDRHVQRILGHLVLPCPADYRRKADDSRY
jgi:hypothetical protein